MRNPAAVWIAGRPCGAPSHLEPHLRLRCAAPSGYGSDLPLFLLVDGLPTLARASYRPFSAPASLPRPNLASDRWIVLRAAAGAPPPALAPRVRAQGDEKA
eukprot:tig00020563_g11332.t1